MANKSSTPKRKKLNALARLKCAENWIKSYHGKNIISGYAKWFGVDKICAIKELKKMNVLIPVDTENQIRQSHKSQIKFKANRKKEKELESSTGIDSDDNFSFIVGYTACGLPFGLTHIESKEIKREEMHK